MTISSNAVNSFRKEHDHENDSGHLDPGRHCRQPTCRNYLAGLRVLGAFPGPLGPEES